MILAALIALQAGIFVPPPQPTDGGVPISAAQAQALQTPPCAVIPASDTLNGSMPVGGCYVDATSTRPTVVQAAKVTTDTSANWSVTWAKPFQSATPYVHAEPIASTSLPINCSVFSATQTGANGRCFQTTTTTLGGTITSIQGTVISPVVNAAANLDVRVIGRETTQ